MRPFPAPIPRPFWETIANPALTVLDIEKFADAATAMGSP